MTGLIRNDELRAQIDPRLPRGPKYHLRDVEDLSGKIRALKDRKDIMGWHMQSHNDCQAHASSTALELVYHTKTSQMVQLARSAMYAMCEVVDGRSIGSDSGTSMQSGVTVAKRYGLMAEDDFPYNQYPVQRSALEKAFKDPMCEKTKFDGDICASPNFDAAVAILVGYGAITVGIDWDPSGFRLDGRGIARSYSGRGGGHALCADFVQYIGSELVIRIANSHSPRREPLAVPGNCFYVTKNWWDTVMPRSRYGVYGWTPTSSERIIRRRHSMTGEEYESDR